MSSKSIKFPRFLRTAVATGAVMSCLIGFSSSSQADYFVWADQKSGVTLSYPDTWKMQNNQQPDDIFSVALPSGEDRATCRIRYNDDGRFKVYPNRFYGDIQQVAYSGQFWDQYNNNFSSVKVHRFSEVTGLGKGFGSMEVISYATAPDELPDYRTGILFVSFYDNHSYLAECSSTAQSYAKYHQQFLDFVKSVDFSKTVHELTIGNYRDFLKNTGEIVVQFPNAVSVSVY